MSRNKDFVIFTIILLFVFALMGPGPSTQSLKWRDRGDRHEGILGQEKGAYLELLSATVYIKNETAASGGSPTAATNTSDNASLIFYAAGGKPISITVREYIRHDYWMKPKPQDKWKNKGWHSFSWPVKDVLAKLDPKPSLHELAAVARMGGDRSRDLIPVLLYMNKDELPAQVNAYRITLRPPDSADVVGLNWTWYRVNGSTAEKIGEYSSPEERLPAGKSFNIDWEPPRQEGWYKLSMKGRLEYPDRGRKLNEEYQLYHQPALEVRQ